MAWGLLLALAAAGCGGSHEPAPPATYPVTGKVRYKDGRPFGGGTIQFLSAGEPALTMTGEIAEDGTFQVETLFRGKRLPGAVAGPCQVLVSPRITESKPVPIYRPPQTYTVKEQSNSFVIEVE
jgi:hypothetical protein